MMQNMERKWYVLKYEGRHHLVPNMGTHAYCGWAVTPEAEFVDAPPLDQREQFRPIAMDFCPRCMIAAALIHERKL